jgi:anti-sigma-K factor RskA
MNPDTHALAGAYAVNAVTAEERDSFEVHLDQCPDCRAEVAELRAAAATLTSDVELSPPPALRASVLSAISQTRQLSPLPQAGEAPVAAQPAPSPTPTAQDEPVVDELAARRRRRVQPWLAGAAAAAVIGVAAATWQPWDDGTSGQQVTATEQVLRADDAQRLEQPMGGSEIAIVRSPSMNKAVFVADAMPTPPTGKAYQLWFDVPGQGMVSAGLIPTANQTVAVMLQGDATVATGAGITLEPATGSQKPTSEPVALFSFA